MKDTQFENDLGNWLIFITFAALALPEEVL